MTDLQDAFKKLVEAEADVASARELLTPHLKRDEIVALCGVVKEIRHFRDVATRLRLKEIADGNSDGAPAQL